MSRFWLKGPKQQTLGLWSAQTHRGGTRSSSWRGAAPEAAAADPAPAPGECREGAFGSRQRQRHGKTTAGAWVGTGCTGRSPLAQGCVGTELPPLPRSGATRNPPSGGALPGPRTWLAELTGRHCLSRCPHFCHWTQALPPSSVPGLRVTLCRKRGALQDGVLGQGPGSHLLHLQGSICLGSITSAESQKFLPGPARTAGSHTPTASPSP